MELERRAFTIGDLELRDASDGLHFRGYAAVFNEWSDPLWNFREMIAPGAFAKNLQEHPDVRMLINHDGVPVARTTSKTLTLGEDERGLKAEATLDPTNPTVAEIRSAMGRGDVNQMSFGFRTIKDEWDEEDPKDVKRTLREVAIHNGDVSIVTYPAYPQTTAEIRARFENRSDVDESAWDGNAAMSACTTAADYRAICAGEKSDGKPDERQHWALPHHKAPGDPPNAAGTRNALARLPQTEGLTNHDAALAHLEAHMKAINPEAKSLVTDFDAAFVAFVTESRAGKVLSAATRDKIRAAIDQLEELLGMSDPDDQQANAMPLDLLEARLRLIAARHAAA